MRSLGGHLALRPGPRNEPIATLTFPLGEEGEEDGDEAAAAGSFRGSESLLVIDPETVVRALAEKMLRKLGYRVTSAANGPAALRLFKAEPDRFDMVICDVAPPEMSGEQIFEAMRAIRPDIKFVLASESADFVAAHRRAPGAYAGFVEKPFRAHDLGLKLRQFFQPRIGSEQS